MVPDSNPPPTRGVAAPSAEVRSTRQKRALSAVLAETDRFRSAQELHAALRARGERVGLIKFGSRVDVWLGPEWSIEVREGDRVKAGSSVLGRKR